MGQAVDGIPGIRKMVVTSVVCTISVKHVSDSSSCNAYGSIEGSYWSEDIAGGVEQV